MVCLVAYRNGLCIYTDITGRHGNVMNDDVKVDDVLAHTDRLSIRISRVRGRNDPSFFSSLSLKQLRVEHGDDFPDETLFILLRFPFSPCPQ